MEEKTHYSCKNCCCACLPIFSFVLPCNHLCSVNALRPPDNTNGILRVVQVVQQHSNHVVPVFRALIGLCRVLIPGTYSACQIRFSSNESTVFCINSFRIRTYLPSASLALAYCRWILGEETCGRSSPTFALRTESNFKNAEKYKGREKLFVCIVACWGLPHQFLQRM